MIYWTLNAKGEVRCQQSKPRKALFFVREETVALGDTDPIAFDQTTHTLTLSQHNEGDHMTVTYTAHHGYGRGVGKQNLITRMLSGKGVYDFSREDKAQCVTEERIKSVVHF